MANEITEKQSARPTYIDGVWGSTPAVSRSVTLTSPAWVLMYGPEGVVFRGESTNNHATFDSLEVFATEAEMNVRVAELGLQ